jgi:medium-chain acyl-[acyl-carrier-protein] hydrolase
MIHHEYNNVVASASAARRICANGWFESLSSVRKHELQLFCFPYAGGNAQIFRPWRQHLPPEVDLWLAHLPGRGRRMHEPPVRRIRPLVERIADTILPELHPPFAFFGHSMGAVISFEVARELRRRRSMEPVHLFVSGRRAPHIPDSQPHIFDLPHDEFINELRKLNGTPQALLENPELVELVLPIIRADFELVETYSYAPEEPLSSSITAYGGVQDADVPVESVSAWKEHTASAFTKKILPGDHFFIHSPMFCNALTDNLAELLHKMRQ